jgi:CheY-like chemotaxis protein
MSSSGVFSRVPQLTILFVDDDSDTRFVYQSIATGEGFGVELAADGHEAIALANVFLPDVIVLDLRLPGLDGVEVARRLRASPRTSSIPIVVASADDTAEGDAAVRASGCEAHLSKPFSAVDLVRLVRVLALRRPDRAPRLHVRAGTR